MVLALNWQSAKPGHELETLREKPMEAAAVRTQASLIQPDAKPAPALPGDADDEETLKDRTALTERRQDAGQPMSMLEAFKASEDASLKNLDHSAAAYPFSAKN